MMQLTLNVKHVNSRKWMSTTFIFLAMLNALSCQSNGWNYDSDGSDNLSEGDVCKLKNGDSGVCKRIEACGPLIEGLRKRTIEYKFLVRCAFIRDDEIICCPIQSQPPSVKPPVSLSLTDRTVTTSSTTIPTTSTTSTTTTTTMTPLTSTTTQRLTIGDVILTGTESFIDLSKILRQKATKRPQTPLQPIPLQSTISFRQPNVPNQFGRTVHWPDQSTNSVEFVTKIRRPPVFSPDAELYDPSTASNILVQSPSANNAVQFPPQLPSGNLQNNSIPVTTDQFAMFEFRPDSDESTVIETNTQRTNSDNNIDNQWVWYSENMSAAPKTDILTTTSQRSPIFTTASPILDSWMLDVLRNATAIPTSTTTTTTPVPVAITVIPV